MPNGELEQYYHERVLKAGKNLEKTRFNIQEVNKFELLDDSPSRIKVVFFDENMDEGLKLKLKLFRDIYRNEKIR